MSLKIQQGPIPTAEQLRGLLIEAADQLIDGADGSLLEPCLQLEGAPILLCDATLHPVLVSFDPSDSEAALLKGLRATQQLVDGLPWVNHLYQPLQARHNPPRLVVVSNSYPPAAQAMLCAGSALSLVRYRIVQISGENGLWLEPLQPTADAASTPPRKPETETPSSPLTRFASNDLLPSLSEAEKAFFEGA
jgi:hypothetical protein